MVTVNIRKVRFFGLFALGITLMVLAVLISTVYQHFYALAPHILLRHDIILFVTLMSFVFGTLAITINLLDGVSNPRETGVGKRVGMGASIVAFTTTLTILMAVVKEWGLPFVFLIGGGGMAIIFLVILFDDEEARRIDIEARTAEAPGD